MDLLLEKIICAAGIPGYEKAVAHIMQQELKKSCDGVTVDTFGNVVGRKGKGKKKIMIAAHMDEIGLVVKHITNDGYLKFIKMGGIDDRVLVGQRVVIKTKKGDQIGIIGTKAPHLQKEEERKKVINHQDMFIDIGCTSAKQASAKVMIGDQIVFEPNVGQLQKGYYYGKAVDDRLGCYVLLKVMEKLKVNAQVYAVATTQEEVGLKGARTASFHVDPDFAMALDTTIAGDTPGITENESSLKLGKGVAITMIEACGRGMIVNEKVKDLSIDVARKHKIKHQIAILEGGMTDGAMISMNRAGILTSVLSIPCRYIHSSTGVFHADDVNSAIQLAVKTIEAVAAGKLK